MRLLLLGTAVFLLENTLSWSKSMQHRCELNRGNDDAKTMERRAAVTSADGLESMGPRGHRGAER